MAACSERVGERPWGKQQPVGGNGFHKWWLSTQLRFLCGLTSSCSSGHLHPAGSHKKSGITGSAQSSDRTHVLAPAHCRVSLFAGLKYYFFCSTLSRHLYVLFWSLYQNIAKWDTFTLPLCENCYNFQQAEGYWTSVIMKLFKQKPVTPKHTKILTRLLNNPWTSKGLTINASFFLPGMNWFCHQQTKCNQNLDLNHKSYLSHS